MKFVTRTIIMLVVINLMMGNFAPAQDVPAQRIAEKSVAPAARSQAPVHVPAPAPAPTPAEPQPMPVPEPVVAQAAPPGSGPYGPSGHYGPGAYSSNKIRSREVLVIPDTDIKAETLMAITEDLQVMSRIFDERFKEPQEIQGVFSDFGDFFGRDSRSTEAIYMQGYGVLFLMEVNFAFSPEPEVQEKQAEETEDADPIWQRTRQKIFSPQGFGGSEFVPKEKYSADKINQLKTELIRTLQHAANIRNIQPDECVILTVIGKARQSGGMYEYNFSRSTTPRTRTSSSRGRSSSSSGSSGSSSGSSGGGMYGGGMGSGGYGVSGRMSGGMGGMAGGGMGGFGGGMMMGGGMMGGGMMGGMEYGETGSASTTVLTIRAKKTDVDDFARSEDFREFQKKVEIFTY
jgi:hypothetical protein